MLPPLIQQLDEVPNQKNPSLGAIYSRGRVKFGLVSLADVMWPLVTSAPRLLTA